MMITWIFFIAVVGVTIWYFNQKTIRALLWEEKKETPIDVLKERFANGEIDEEEFEKHKSTLEDKK